MNSSNICIIEDERDIRESIGNFFDHQGYNVHTCSNYSDFKNKDLLNMKGLYLIDWDLGESVTGPVIIDKIREVNKDAIIFMLTGNTHANAATEALKKGADDYIRKPFQIEELALKIENRFQRIKGEDENKPLTLIPDVNAFQHRNSAVKLTIKEYTIFEILFLSRGEIVSREEIMKSFNENITTRNIDVHIHSLRKKIQPDQLKIRSIRGHGYMLEE